MDGLTLNLLLAAIGVAFVHTALGPDHYLPFVMLAKARHWSIQRTLCITAACGVGHVLSSLALGGIGIGAGVAIGALESIELYRADVAAWVLFGVGIAYLLWGIRKALREHSGFELHEHHGEVHVHAGGLVHHHHRHARGDADSSGTFWTLFLVFVLGPCEPLIPLFMVPASESRWGEAALTGLVFGIVTVATMLAITAAAVLGVAKLPLGQFQRWAHAMAGGVIALSASAMLFLGP